MGARPFGERRGMFRNIPLSEIDPNPEQPREHFAGIEELAHSIRAEGLLEPIMVRPLAGRYQIVHGERRYRAAKQAGLSEVPAVVREMDDATMFRLSLVENVQRAALTPMEEAASFAKLREQGHAQAEIGRIIGKGQSYVAHKLRLLKVPRPLTHYLEVGALTENHLRQALRLKAIIGEGIPDDLGGYAEALEGYEKAFADDGAGPDAAANRAAAVVLARMRPYGRVDLIGGEALIGGMRRWAEYVSEHNAPPPLWERHAFWALSFMACSGMNVVQASRLIDKLRDICLSAIANHVLESMDRENVSWGRYAWAVYHDLKHAGLLDVVRAAPADRSEEANALWERALEYVSHQNSLTHPTEAQGPGADTRLLEEIEARFGVIALLGEDGEE